MDDLAADNLHLEVARDRGGALASDVEITGEGSLQFRFYFAELGGVPSRTAVHDVNLQLGSHLEL